MVPHSSFLLLAVLASAQSSHWWDLHDDSPLGLGGSLGGSLVSFRNRPTYDRHHSHDRHHFVELDETLVSGRYKLKHHLHDGLEEVLKAFEVPDEDIEAMRDATIITVIEIGENENISISTMDTAVEEQSNTVTFKIGKSVNITNPLNGETVEFLATIISPTTIQTMSEGQDSGTLETKTWEFSPTGVAVTTEVLKDNRLYTVTSHQVMVRVDSNNKEKRLKLAWA